MVPVISARGRSDRVHLVAIGMTVEEATIDGDIQLSFRLASESASPDIIICFMNSGLEIRKPRLSDTT